jgi:hypothetical protein
VLLMTRRLFLVSVLVVFVGAGMAPQTGVQRGPTAKTLPSRLSDQDFWRLSSEFSEANGYFRSENLVSNEHTFQYVIPALKASLKPGGVYLGVAPDQNFTYIVAIQPKIAFIVDIRRGNLLEHLMYKALIELSTDRADFLSRLFSRKRPAGLGPASAVTALFEAYDRVPASEDLYRLNLRAMQDQLVKKHGFSLTEDDLDQLESIYYNFYWEGPGLRYSSAPMGFSGRGFSGSTFPSYEELMMQTDLKGNFLSYLAGEEAFRFLKDFQERNLLVPVVGNFAGPKALRQVGQYIREHGATVTAFYVSNVEQYLFQDGLFDAFARNVVTLPVDENSTFIRSVSNRYGYGGSGMWSDGRATARDPIKPFVRDFLAGNIRQYSDVNSRSK